MSTPDPTPESVRWDPFAAYRRRNCPEPETTTDAETTP